MKRVLSAVNLLCLLLLSNISPTIFAVAQGPVKPGLSLLESDESGVTISLFTPEYKRGEIFHDGGRYQQLQVPGYEQTNEPGYPRLPHMNVLVGVPPHVRVWTEVVSSDTQLQKPPLRIEPAPSPVALQVDLQPGEWQVLPDSLNYQDDANYPGKPVEIVEEAWIRNQQVVRLALYPFQYNPLQGELLWHRQLQVRIHFEEKQGKSSEVGQTCLGDCWEDGPYDQLLDQSLLNAEQAQNWRNASAFRSS